MEPVFVPKPAQSAFNKNRRVSDLLMGQLKHFQHVERTNGIAIEPAISREVHTENGAARYITAMTRAIRAQATQSHVPSKLPSNVLPLSTSRSKKSARLAAGLSIAAEAITTKEKTNSPSKGESSNLASNKARSGKPKAGKAKKQ